MALFAIKLTLLFKNGYREKNQSQKSFSPNTLLQTLQKQGFTSSSGFVCNGLDGFVFRQSYQIYD